MIDQVMIGVCGVTSVFLSQAKTRNVQRWACLFGLAAQPFWFYATWKAEQWGIMALTVVYSIGWLRGIWNYWVRP